MTLPNLNNKTKLELAKEVKFEDHALVMAHLKSTRPGQQSILAPFLKYKDKTLCIFWSGGMDSTLAVLLALTAGCHVQALNVKANTPNGEYERAGHEALQSILRRYADSCKRSIQFNSIEPSLPLIENSAWGQMPWWITTAQYHHGKVDAVVFSWLASDDNAPVFDDAIAAYHSLDFVLWSGHKKPPLILPFRKVVKLDVIRALKAFNGIIPFITYCENPIKLEATCNEFTGGEDAIKAYYEFGKNHTTVTHMEQIPCQCCNSCTTVRRALQGHFGDRDDNFALFKLAGWRHESEVSLMHRHLSMSGELERMLYKVFQPFIAKIPPHLWGEPLNVAKIVIGKATREVEHFTLNTEPFRIGVLQHNFLRETQRYPSPASYAAINRNASMRADSVIYLPDSNGDFQLFMSRLTDALLAMMFKRTIVRFEPISGFEHAYQMWDVRDRYYEMFRTVLRSAIPAAIIPEEAKVERLQD